MDSALYLARHQNKELMFALKSKKRSISDLRGQLQHEKQQTAVAEELLSVLDRSYNQVHIYPVYPAVLYPVMSYRVKLWYVF